MSKLLFIFERDMPTISITREVFLNLKTHDNIKSSFIYLADVTPVDIDDNDVIIFMRPNNTYSWIIAKKAKEAGHTVVTFCDDDLLNLPVTSPTIPWRKNGLKKTLAYSDVIWSSSRYIAEKYRTKTMAKRSAVIDTIIQPEELENIKAPCNDKVKIVYAAAPSHAELFEKYIAPIVPIIAREYDVSFTFVSVHPIVNGIECEYVPGMPLIEYRKYMKNRGFDIGLAPLYTDEFSKCKYFNKYIEYTMQGIVGIYSKTEPYTYVIRDGENGFLASDDPKDWLRALKEAISSKDKRRKCVKNAIECLKKDFSEDDCIERVISGLPEIIQVSDSYNKCEAFNKYKALYYLYRPLDWIYLLAFYLKRTGIKAVIRKIKQHFVEIKAYKRRKLK